MLAGIVLVLVLELIALVVVIYWGAYNISTYNHDNRLMNRALDTGMTRAVAHHARSIQVPDNLFQQDTVQAGARRYHEMCAECHGAPGIKPGEIAQGLWPKAPNLMRTAPTWTASELFWITKYGIKFSAMPAWGPTHDDEKIWSIVAFLEKLPQLSPAEYFQLEHPGSTNQPAETPGRSDDHGSSSKPEEGKGQPPAGSNPPK